MGKIDKSLESAVDALLRAWVLALTLGFFTAAIACGLAALGRLCGVLR